MTETLSQFELRLVSAALSLPRVHPDDGTMHGGPPEQLGMFPPACFVLAVLVRPLFVTAA